MLKGLFKGIKNATKKIFKGIRKVVKPVGKVLKEVLKPFGKLQQKLGPVGTMALMFIAPYALPAIWGAFGAWAGALQGPMAGLMQGIHTAGVAVGKAYTTVTGFISDTIGKIAGNTIGKIPLGADKTVASVWKDFTGWAARTLESNNLKFGNDIVTQGADGALIDSKGFASAKDLGLKNQNILELAPPTEIQIQPDLAFDEGSLLDMGTKTIKPTIDIEKVAVGFDRTVPTGLPKGVQGSNIAPKFVDVPTSFVEQNPELLANTKAMNSYANTVNSITSQKLQEGYTVGKAVAAQGADVLKDIQGIQAGYETLKAEGEGGAAEQLGGDSDYALSIGRPVDTTSLIDSAADFSTLSQAYADAGYGGLNTPQQQYQSGAYGGAGFATRLNYLAPTIQLPRV